MTQVSAQILPPEWAKKYPAGQGWANLLSPILEVLTMKPSVQISELDGYNEFLEVARKAKFDEFLAETNPEKKRDAYQGFAFFTSLRSRTLLLSYDRALGLHHD